MLPISIALAIVYRICYNFGTYHMVIDIVNFGLNSWTPILRSLEYCIIGEDSQNVAHSDYQVVRCVPTLNSASGGDGKLVTSKTNRLRVQVF